MSWDIDIKDALPVDCELDPQDGLPVKGDDLVSYDKSLTEYIRTVREHLKLPRRVKRLEIRIAHAIRKKILDKQLAQGLAPAAFIEPGSIRRLAVQHPLNCQTGSGLVVSQAILESLVIVGGLSLKPLSIPKGSLPGEPSSDPAQFTIDALQLLLTKASTELNQGVQWRVTPRVVTESSIALKPATID